MFKKILIGTITAILLGALLISVYDFSTGASSLQLPTLASGSGAGQGNQANRQGGNQQSGQNGNQAGGQGGNQQSGQNGNQAGGQGGNQQSGQNGNHAGGQGGNQQSGQNGNHAGGQGGNQQMGGLSLTPADWFTMTGQVVAVTANNLTVQTTARGELALQLGRPGFATQQGVTFNVGDTVTILAFDSPEGLVQAGQITNDTTQQFLYLRDPNGRPLWAGQGGGGNGGQGRGQGGGQGRGQVKN